MSAKCANCKRPTALYTIRDAFQTEANGKKVCDSSVCWGSLTHGYPATGIRLKEKN